MVQSNQQILLIADKYMGRIFSTKKEEEIATVEAPVSLERPDEIERARVRVEKAKADQEIANANRGTRFGE